MGHIDEKTGLLKISWSKVRLAGECPQKMHLIASGMKSPVSDVTMFYKGNVVDQAMRRWLSAQNQDPEWMRSHVDQIFDELEQEIAEGGDGAVRWRDAQQRFMARAECREAVARLEHLLREKALPYEFQPALRFETRLRIPGLEDEPREVLLVGEMDLLTREQPSAGGFRGKPRLRIWDLKMTKDGHYWLKTISQLVFYDIACFCMFGEPSVEAGLLQPMVDAQPWMSFTPSDEDRTQMLTRIVGVAHMIWRNDVAPKASSEGCDRCECRHACAKFAPEPGTKTIRMF